MLRVGADIGKLNATKRVLTDEERVCAAWRAAVGPKIAPHARAERMVRTRLVVGVDDAIWRNQLFTLNRTILANLADLVGKGVVTDIEFHVVPQRRGPERAKAPAAADEANDIRDPGMRRLYLQSRKKETA